jgi:hypothetical protein
LYGKTRAASKRVFARQKPLHRFPHTKQAQTGWLNAQFAEPENSMLTSSILEEVMPSNELVRNKKAASFGEPAA